jgi:histidinol-phosphate aminotransferase
LASTGALPEDLRFPLAAITQLESRPRLLFICNPNNPTGTLVDPATLVALARSAPQTLVVVDELYVAFTGQSVVPLARELTNVVALQSLSKAAGLAALRLGFAVGHPTIVERLRRVTGPYDINMVAVVAGKTAMADPEHTRRCADVLAARECGPSEATPSRCALRRQGQQLSPVWPPGDCQGSGAGARDQGFWCGAWRRSGHRRSFQ